MKRISIISLFIFVLCITSPAFAQSAAEQAAEKYWNAMPNRTDVSSLDELIERFPNTETAKLAFLTRYFLLTQNPTIEDYNDFLKKYPQRFQSQMVLQEVFNLYKEQNRAATWLDFLNRYPGTQQGLAAKLHLQTLMAQFAMLCDEEDTYDDFIAMFPDAPQIPAIMELAEKKALEREKALFDETNQKYADDWQRRRAELEDIATAMATDLGNWNTEYNKIYKDDKDPIIENGEAFLLAARIRRYEKILTSVYKSRPAALTVRQEERHREMMAKLDSIQQTLIDNHRELVKTIREEAAEARKVMREEFAKLGHKLDASFDMLDKKMDVLHNDLVSVYQELQKVNANLENIAEKIDKSNELLAKIDRNLGDIHKTMADGFFAIDGRLVEFQGAMENMMGILIDEVADFKVQTIARFDVVIENQDRSYALQIKQYETDLKTLAMTEEIRDGQRIQIWQGDELIKIGKQHSVALNNIQRNQVQQLNTINGLRGDMQQGFQGMRNDMRQGLQHLNNTMQMGFSEMKRSINDASNRVIQSNQQTLQRIQQQQQSASRSSSGGIKGLFGKVLPVVGTVVGTAFGGPVGGAIGATLGSGLGSVVAGGNQQDHLNTMVSTGISAGVGLASDKLQTVMPDWKPSTYPNTQIPFPPAQQIFDNVVAQGKNTLKSELESQIRDRLSSSTVPLVNSILNGNFEQRKALAIQSVASMLPSGVPQKTIQNIRSARNEQELRNTLVNTARENGLKPEVIMYAMDYIL